MPAKEKMGPNMFYNVRTRSRVEVDPATITVAKIDGKKYRDGNPRFQAIGLTESGDKVYKFIAASVARDVYGAQ